MKPWPFKQFLPVPSSQPMAPIHLFSFSVDLPPVDVLYKQNPTIWPIVSGFFRSACFPRSARMQQVSDLLLFHGERYSTAWTEHSWSRPQLVDAWVVSTVGLLWLVMLWTFGFQYLSVFGSLESIPRRNCWVAQEFCLLPSWWTAKLFSTVADSFHSPTSNIWGFQSLPVLPTLVVFWCFEDGQPGGYGVVSHCGSDLYVPFSPARNACVACHCVWFLFLVLWW